MKTQHLTLLFLLFYAQVAMAQNQWTWVGGDQGANINGTYGSRGVADPSNQPGGRRGAATWKDSNGNLWIFGGRGAGENASGLLNDLWRYNSASNEWTWFGGDKTPDATGNYGIQGIPLPTNHPGARENAVAWTDERGDLWLFGGAGYAAGTEIGLLNDLWHFSMLTRMWTWIRGSADINTTGEYGERTEYSLFNEPGGRVMAASWRDKDGNLWMFGGLGYSSDDDLSDLNDVWVYSVQTNRWAWMKGDDEEDADARYGERGDFDDDNTPGGRRGSTAWIDNDGNFWLFGGQAGQRLYSDLWKFDVQRNDWAWMSGSRRRDEEPEFEQRGVPDPDGNPGARVTASGWTDTNGDLWLFGGKGYGEEDESAPLNSLWKYSITGDTWTYLKGDIDLDPPANFGTKGVAAVSNVPGGMNNSSTWEDNQGNFWIYGGESASGFLNQVWMFTVKCGTEINGNISPATASICEGGSQVLTATGGTSYEWRLNGELIEGVPGASLRATEPGTYSVIIKNINCSAPAANTAVITRATAPTGNISPATSSICPGGSQVLTATGGTSYQWHRNGNLLGGQTSATLTVREPGTYTVVITNGTCTGPASNEAVVNLVAQPGIRYADTTIDANVAVQLAARPAGVSYNWTPPTGLDNPLSRTPVVTTNTERLYFIQITTNEGCTITDTQLVKIKGVVSTRIFVPSAFSPNNNGVNDRLRPVGNIGTINSFRVYNRWGNLVFETNQPGQGWDGIYKGALQPADTYTWILLGTTADGQQVKQTGKTLLIR